MKTALGIFCKQPIPGTVKTRLAADIGDEAAARLYEAFLTDIVERLRSVAQGVVLCYTPDTPDAREYFQQLAGAFVGLVPQRGDDLGERLAGFFGYAGDPEKVTVIGSDTPTITRAHIQESFAVLDRYDAVLGRSEDGGYYLVGLRGYRAGLFDDIDWSTSVVFEQQRARFSAAGFETAELSPIPEVDTIEDLHKLIEDPMLSECKHTCRVLDELKLR
jgi:uncharacterized protein